MNKEDRIKALKEEKEYFQNHMKKVRDDYNKEHEAGGKCFDDDLEMYEYLESLVCLITILSKKIERLEND